MSILRCPRRFVAIMSEWSPWWWSMGPLSRRCGLVRGGLIRRTLRTDQELVFCARAAAYRAGEASLFKVKSAAENFSPKLRVSRALSFGSKTGTRRTTGLDLLAVAARMPLGAPALVLN